jgi:hypothetical protein
MQGKISEAEFEFASSLIIDLIKDDNKQEVDFSSTSLSPCNIALILDELGIKQINKTKTSNCEDFFTSYEGGLVLWYNVWLFTLVLMKGSNYNGFIQDTKAENN